MKKNNITDITEMHTRELEVTPSAPVNEYYIDVANKFRTAKFIAVIILVVFILLMISAFRGDITLENCKYLVRFFTSAHTVYSGDYDDIYYDTAGVVSVNMFNEDLAAVKNDSIELYDLNGNNVASYELNQTTPTVVTAGKYMLVYDMGSNGFKLFNNFSQLTSQTYDYPISVGTVSPEGMYAIVTKSLDYQSVIHLYDHNFNLISKVYKDKYITDIKISDGGDKLLCTSVYAENGGFVSEIMTYAPYTEDPESTVTLNGSYAAKCGFFSQGGYSVLTDSALLFFDSSNKQISKYELGSNVPTDVLMLDDHTVLCYSENIVGSHSRVLIFDRKGEIQVNTAVEDKILCASAFLDELYILTDGRATRLDMNTGEMLNADIENSPVSIFTPDANTMVICYSHNAKAYKTGEIFKQYITEETQ